MNKLLYVLSAILVCMACSGNNPESPAPVNYKNTFTLVGPQFQAEKELSVVDASTGISIGTATLAGGEGTEHCTWELKTNAEAGTQVRIFCPSSFSAQNASLSSVQTYAQNSGTLYPEQVVAWSSVVKLDKSWPTEFSLSSPLSFIRVIASVPDGSALDGGKLRSFKMETPEKGISGSFSAHFEDGSLSVLPSSTEYVEASFLEPVVLGSKEVSFILGVFPGDLRNVTCSFTAIVDAKGGEKVSVSGTFEGRKLEAREVYSLEVESLGGITSPANKSLPEFSYINIDYKVNGTDNTYVKGRSLTVDGMNWMVKYNTNPSDRWGGLPGVKPDQICSSNPQGYWRTGKFHGRHVMVDPDGNIAMLHGVNGVTPDAMKEATSQLSQKEFKSKFGTDVVAWAQFANQTLTDNHFNFYSTNPKRVSSYKDFISDEVEQTLRGFTDYSRQSHVEIAYLLRSFSWDYYTASHSRRGYNNAEVNIAALMFDPYYLSYIDNVAKDAAAISKGKTDFIGWYLDNELQFRWANDSKPGIYLKEWLVLEEGADYCQANVYAKAFAKRFMQEKYGVEPLVENITDQMEDAFLAEVVRYYYRTASEAIRRHDPDHLVIGSRLHGLPRQIPEIVKACAEYCDIVSINIYSMWEPDDSYFKNKYSVWVSDFDKPFMVSEFYVRDADALYEGKPYSKTGEGGGWYVKGQADRGRFYQEFTRKLISYDNCVGWQWFQMTDDYAESYNGWNNKGIVSPKYVPYSDCLSYMARLNRNIYQIMDYYKPGITEDASTEAIPGANWK